MTLAPHLGLVAVDATAQGNSVIRAGPLPAADAGSGGWTVHAYIDHCIIELIVSNATALVVYAAPSEAASEVALKNVQDSAASLEVWRLASIDTENKQAAREQEASRPGQEAPELVEA